MKRTGIAVIAGAAALFLISGGAFAGDFECIGLSTGGTFHNVVVPEGESCTLDNARVTGHVHVKKGGTLEITATAGVTTIAGDVKGEGCDSIHLNGLLHRIVIGGNVTIEKCTGSSFSGCTGSSIATPPPTVLIGGNFKCNDNHSSCAVDYCVISGKVDCSGNASGCTIQSSAIGKDATLKDNSGGATNVSNSSIGDDLKCSGNSGGVGNFGNPNTVAGTRSGQCSAL